MNPQAVQYLALMFVTLTATFAALIFITGDMRRSLKLTAIACAVGVGIGAAAVLVI